LTKLKVRDDLAVAELDGESVIYDQREDGLYHLNQSATMVFQLCDGSATTDQIALDIAEVGELPYDTVLAQVQTVVTSFEDLGLLDGSVPQWERDDPQPVLQGQGQHQHQHHLQHAHQPQS
jgi:hypothetical protein